MPYQLGIRPLNSGELIIVGLLGCRYTGVDESMHGHELHMFKNSIHDMVRSKARLKGYRHLFLKELRVSRGGSFKNSTLVILSAGAPLPVRDPRNDRLNNAGSPVRALP
jgi:hypothetical protein